jgi:hypothetical protein
MSVHIYNMVSAKNIINALPIYSVCIYIDIDDTMTYRTVTKTAT